MYKILNRGGNAPTETIKIMPLDGFLAKNKISARNVKYIWIDTEGFEVQVLLGAKNLIANNPAPIFMECNLNAWDKSGPLRGNIDVAVRKLFAFYSVS